jgi:hypothetical protein
MKRRIGIIHLSKFQTEKTGNWLTKHFVFEQHKRAVCHSIKKNGMLTIIDNILAYEVTISYPDIMGLLAS